MAQSGVRGSSKTDYQKKSSSSFFFISHGHRPLGPDMKSFHFARSCVIRTASVMASPVHSVMLSIHRFGGLPLCRFPYTVPKRAVWTNLLSGMRHTCPKSASFLFFIVSTKVCCRFSSVRISSFVIFSCHLMFNSRR